MREIKFRAWDKEKERMMYMENAEFILEYCGVSQFTEFGDRRSIFPELMQYTGLKDKNGVCIFESDIIKGDLYDSRLPTMGEVVFDDHFSFYANKNEAGNTPLHRINNIEIIGNIYEDSELVDK